MMLNMKHVDIKFALSIIFIFLFTTSGFGQISNHDYPRVGFLQWGDATPAYDAKFDLIITKRREVSYAQFIKSKNPKAIVLPTEDIMQGDWIGRNKMPDAWWLRDSKGVIIPLYDSWKWADYTDYCPPSSSFNNKRFNQAIGNSILTMVDLNVFDGIATDGLWVNGWANGVSDVDIDRNGINDFSEHGSNWVTEQLKTGAYHTLESIRNAIGEDKIIFVNTGTFHDEAWDVTNGLWLEHNEGIYNSWRYFWTMYQDFMAAAHQPQVLLNDGLFGKDNFTKMRHMLCLTLLGNGYFGSDCIWNHYGSNWYDEYESELGYPISAATMIPGTESSSAGAKEERGVWVRFFEKGVSIVNPTERNVTITDNQLRQIEEYSGPYYRFLGGQNPTFNNGELFTSVTLTGSYESSGGNILTIGDGIILVTKPKVIVSDIYIDNCNIGTSPSHSPIIFSGSWIKEENKSPDSWQIAYHAWGDEYIYPFDYSNSGNGSNKATFKPNITVAGYYEIFEWHGESGASNVPYTITYSAGQTASGTINQSQNLGQWNLLGTYYFDKGDNDFVVINNNANNIVIADAMMFVYKGDDNVVPNAPTGLKSDGQTESSITLSWTPPLPASDGDIASLYRINRNNSFINDVSSTAFTDKNLMENTTYQYAVHSVDDASNISIDAVTGEFTTRPDLTPPEVMAITLINKKLLEITFNEPLEQSSTENIGNYSINNGVVITNSSLINDQIVRLTTSDHIVGITYTITISNVRDASSTGNAITATRTYVGIENITVVISVDNEYEIYINGNFVNSADTWEDAETYTAPLVDGKNVVAVKAIDVGGEGGLVAEISIDDKKYVSDDFWYAATSAPADWMSLNFNDKSWMRATTIGAHGIAVPWANYHNVKDISIDSGVQWIWSADIVNDNIVYLRFNFNKEDSVPPEPPTGVKVVNP